MAKFLVTLLAEPGKSFSDTQETQIALLQRAGFSRVKYRCTTYTDQDPHRIVGLLDRPERFHWSAHGEDQNLTYLMLIGKVTKAKAVRKLKKKTK